MITPSEEQELRELDPYLLQMVSDLKSAEALLRTDINYRGMSFSAQRLQDSKENVERLHEKIRSYQALRTKHTTKEVSHE